MTVNALLVCRMQNDFCDGGPVQYEETLTTIPLINRIRTKFDNVIFIKSSHPKDHVSFKENGGTFPKHCIEDTYGAELNSGLIVEEKDNIVNIGTLSIYESYSGFYDAKTIGKKSSLEIILSKKKITDIYLCGVELEGTIFSTALDSLSFRYNTFIILDACLCKNPKMKDKNAEHLSKMGSKIILSNSLL